MKRQLLLTNGLALSMLAFGQNWTATDMNGVQHNLQSYLDEGKTVLVDLSAHWCGPCWQWHKSGIMDFLMHEYGPGGTDQLMIFFIDASSNPPSNMNLLNGIGSGTQGNWAEGTNYPIIGPNGQGQLVGSQYNFNAFPTLFVHCPGGGPAQTIQRSSLWQFFSNWRGMCPDAFETGPNDATLLDISADEFCPGDPLQTAIYNCGSSPLTSATVQLRQGGNTLETINWTGNLAPHALPQVVTFNTTATSAGTLTAEVSMPNGQADDNPSGNAEDINVQLATEIATTQLEVKINTDNYGSETYWRITNQNGETIVDGGNTAIFPNLIGVGTGSAPNNPNAYSNNQEYTHLVNLFDIQCYSFEIYDYYGDGMCCSYGTGSYEVRDVNTDEIIFSGGAFAASEVKKMQQTVTSVEDNLIDNTLAIYPNPTNGLLNVEFSMPAGAQARMQVFNLLGEVVLTMDRSLPAGEQRQVVDMSSLSNGIYYLNIAAGDVRATRKITVTR